MCIHHSWPAAQLFITAISSEQTAHSQIQSDSTKFPRSAGGRSQLPIGDVLKQAVVYYVPHHQWSDTFDMCHITYLCYAHHMFLEDVFSRVSQKTYDMHNTTWQGQWCFFCCYIIMSADQHHLLQHLLWISQYYTHCNLKMLKRWSNIVVCCVAHVSCAKQYLWSLVHVIPKLCLSFVQVADRTSCFHIIETWPTHEPRVSHTSDGLCWKLPDFWYLANFQTTHWYKRNCLKLLRCWLWAENCCRWHTSCGQSCKYKSSNMANTW